MSDPIVTVAWLTLIGTCVTAIAGIIGATYYVIRRDPAAARNGTLASLAQASLELKNAAVRMNEAHHEYMAHMETYEQRNRDEHQLIIKQFERLADIIAPRRMGGL